MPSGKPSLISAIAVLTFSATSIALAPGSMSTLITAAFSPSIPLSVLYDCASSETRATSLILRMVPSSLALTMIFSNSLSLESLPVAVMGVVMSTFSMGCCPSTPAADSRFWSRIALWRSPTVRPMLASLSGCTHICIA